jgi:hypothetical protein
MYVDPTGHFITAALIGSIVAVFLIGIGSKYLPDVINKIDENGFQWNDLIEPWEENWMEYTISGLSGAVVGASFGLGLGFGAAAYQAGMVISTGTVLTTLAGVTIGSFAAGVGIYALETKVFNLCEYDYGEMWQAGLHMGIRGVTNFGMGLLIGNQGFYTDYTGIQGIIMRTYLKSPIMVPFEMILDGIFEAW